MLDSALPAFPFWSASSSFCSVWHDRAGTPVLYVLHAHFDMF
jgi:hypothetical protein